MTWLNKQAFHDYTILDKLEAGIMLTGFEVKAIRTRGIDLGQSIIHITPALEVFLANAYIPAYQGGKQGYDERRQRKLLLHEREIKQWYGKIQQGNYRIVPLKLYERRNHFKLEIGLGKHKKQFEKREQIKQRDVMRAAERELRGEKDSR